MYLVAGTVGIIPGTLLLCTWFHTIAGMMASVPGTWYFVFVPVLGKVPGIVQKSTRYRAIPGTWYCTRYDGASTWYLVHCFCTYTGTSYCTWYCMNIKYQVHEYTMYLVHVIVPGTIVQVPGTWYFVFVQVLGTVW